MTRIHDFHFFGVGYVIVTLMGISRCPCWKGSTGGCHSGPGGRRRRAERGAIGRGIQTTRGVIPSSAMSPGDSPADEIERLTRLLRDREAEIARAHCGDERRSSDHASAPNDREDAARALWTAQRAQGAPARPDGASAGGARSDSGGG